MKKRLSVLLIGSLVAISLAGCSGTNAPSETPAPGESTTESSVQSEQASTENSKKTDEKSSTAGENSKTADVSEKEQSTENPAESNPSTPAEQSETAVSQDEEDMGPKEGDIIVDENGNEYVYHEDSSITPVGENSTPVASDVPTQEESTKYLDVTYTPIDVKDSNVDSGAINMSNPKYYLLSSTAELKDFLNNYEKTFSLNDVENGVPFDTLAEKFDDTYFEFMSVVVIPVQYDKNTETEVGTITIEGNDYVIEVCTQPAEKQEDLNTLCFVVQTNKSDMEGKDILIRVVEEDTVEEIEEEI